MTLETKRLTLRPMTAEDANALLKVFTDPNVLAAFSLESWSRERMVEWVDENLVHQTKFGYGLFAVILRDSGELIGNCGLEHTTFEDEPYVEIGYDFHSDFWNQGFATEAASAVRDYAVNELGLDPGMLCSFIRQTNKASMRVSEKVGMRRVKPYRKYDTDYFLYKLT